MTPREQPRTARATLTAYMRAFRRLYPDLIWIDRGFEERRRNERRLAAWKRRANLSRCG